jgi:predicted amidohydrolase YtcJ
MKNTLFLVIALLLFITACTTPPATNTADTILYGAAFFTADSTEIEAIALQGNRIMAVGSKAEILKLKGEKTEMLDLTGKFVMPGLIEGHGHFQAMGRSLIDPNLMPTKSYTEVVQLIEKSKEFAQKDEWISGRGWHQEKWTSVPEGAVEGYPTHDALSKITPNNPVILDHASGHALLANARAMQLSGVTKATKDPVGGRILRDKLGNPTGVFEENAMLLIQKTYDEQLNTQSAEVRYKRFSDAIKKASAEAIRSGITSFQDAGSTLSEVAMYKKASSEGLLNTRLWVMVLQPQKHEYEAVAQAIYQDSVGQMLKVAAIKAYFDGALGSYGAWLLEPYSDKPGFVGQNTTPTDSIKVLAALCAKLNLQFCVHGIGDKANREILNVFESALGGKTDLRWRIEHAQHVDPNDMPRFAKMGVIASMQPIHCTSDQPFVVKRLGEPRARASAYPWRALIDSGARFCGGTDVPVELIDPFANIYAAVTRKRIDTGAALYPEQALTRKEALLAYTAWNAYAAGEEHQKGALKQGLLADLVVLDRNLLQCPVEQIPATQVESVWLGGKKQVISVK